MFLYLLVLTTDLLRLILTQIYLKVDRTYAYIEAWAHFGWAEIFRFRFRQKLNWNLGLGFGGKFDEPKFRFISVSAEFRFRSITKFDWSCKQIKIPILKFLFYFIFSINEKNIFIYKSRLRLRFPHWIAFFEVLTLVHFQIKQLMVLLSVMI